MSPAKWKAIVALVVAALSAAAAFFPDYAGPLSGLAGLLTGGAFVPRPGDIPFGEPK